MKINSRLFLLTFIIVVTLSLIYTTIYYTITIKLLRTQQIKSLQISANNYKYYLETKLISIKNEFSNYSEEKLLDELISRHSKLDFLIEFNNLNLNYKIYFKDKVEKEYKNLDDFIKEYPGSIIWKITNQNLYYGVFFTLDLLEEPAKTNQIGVAFISNGFPIEITGKNQNESYILQILNSVKKLNNLKKPAVYEDESGNTSFVSLYHSIYSNQFYPKSINVVLFSVSEELIQFKQTIQILLAIIVATGTILTLISVFLFTWKLRKQINFLNYASEVTAKGELSHRVKIISKDELGKLGVTFNNMIDELQKKSIIESNYNEFITLINQNPSLNEIANKALEKIAFLTRFKFGSLFLVDGANFTCIASYGLNHKSIFTDDHYVLEKIKKTGEKTEYIFEDNVPVLKVGFLEVKIGYVQLIPIAYNKEVLGILELASETQIEPEEIVFLDSFLEQLAIGVFNAKSVEKLEKLVNELQILNTDYQSQNLKITEQNKQLIDLHLQLKEKAEELEKQKLKAEELYNAKSQFLTNITHDLKTPLNSILGLSDLLITDKSISAGQKEKMVVILRNSKKLLYLINNILEFSKTESGKLEVKNKEFNLKEYILTIQNYIYPQAVEKNIEMRIDMVGIYDCVVFTDPDILEQIIINILSNAVKYTDKGEVELSINLKSSDLVIHIKDSGIGIPENEKIKIFNEYQRGIDNIPMKTKGTGLGLAICQKYIQLLNGNISLESSVGKGSVFTIYLPDVIKKILKAGETSDVVIGIFSKESKNIALYRDYLVSKNISLNLIHNPADSLNHNVLLIDINSNDAEEIFISSVKLNKRSRIFPFYNDYNLSKGYMVMADEYIFDSDLERFIGKYYKTHKKLIITERNLLLNRFNDLIIENPEITEDLVANISPDYIFIDLTENQSKNLFTLARLRKSKKTREININLIIDDNFYGNSFRLFKQDLKNLAVSNNYHPIDTCNVLRKSIKIESNFLEIEETEESSGSKTILVVDDDRDALFTVSEILKENLFKVYQARNGVECLELLEINKPDLVLLDIMMPEMDGFETISRIRNNPDTENLKVVALTAYAMIENKDVLERKGFDGLITKPIIVSELINNISKYIKEKI